jgi:hypothetical protein
MRASKIDHSFAALERAADRARVEPFAKPCVTQAAKARIASAFNHCEEAASDLERFLAHAAADAKDRSLHRVLYDAAKEVGDLPITLRAALEAVDAFVEVGGTAIGALQRAGLEACVSVCGRSDATILEAVEHAFLRALSVYDDALEEIVGAPPGFADVIVEQRKTLSRWHRELAARPPCDAR